MSDVTDLGEHLETFISALVSDGRYKNRTSVLRQSVLLLEEQERKLRLLDLALDRGLADVAAGRVHSSEEVRTYLRERFGAWAHENEV